MESIRVHLPEDLRQKDDEFLRFCQHNPDLEFERRRNGDTVFMANTGGESGNYNSKIGADLKDAREKMDDWMANGCRLGWLIDPTNQPVYIYRPGQPVEESRELTRLSGEAVLPGFVLDLTTLL